MALDSTIVQQIIDQLQTTTQKLAETAAKVDIVVENLATHNADSTAHPYIQKMIEDLDVVSADDLAGALTGHNTSATAHADIRALIPSTTDISTAVSTAITTHDSSSVAHPGLRTLISNLTNTVNLLSTDVEDMNTTVTEIDNRVGGGIETHNEDPTAHPSLLTAVQSLNTDIDVVRNNRQYLEQLPDLFGDGTGGSLDELTEQLSTTNSNVATLAHQTAVNRQNIALLGAMEENLLDSLLATNGRVDDLAEELSDVRILATQTNYMYLAGQPVDMTGFSHNLPPVVARSTTVDFSMTGVTIPDGGTLTYTIDPRATGFTFSKVTDIAQDEVITATIPSTATEGSLLCFLVTATLGPSNDQAVVAIGTRINRAPVIDSMQDTVPAQGVPGSQIAVKFWGAYDPDGQDITYTITPTSGDLVFSKLTGITDNEEVALSIPAALTDTSVATFNLSAIDNMGEATTKTYSLLGSDQTDVDGFTNDVPSRVGPDKQYTVHFGGITSGDGGTVTYAIVADGDSPITFTPNTEIVDGANVFMTVPASVVRGSTHTFTVTITTSAGETFIKTLSTIINALPNIANLATTIPAMVIPGQSYPVTISGGLDSDTDQFLTYTLAVNNANLGFSKVTGITNNQEITLDVSGLAIRGSSTNITITASDGVESVTTTVSTVINTKPDVTNLVTTGLLPYLAPGQSYQLTLAGATDIDASQTLAYTLSSDNTGLSFSKTSGIAANESVTVTVAASAVRGSTAPIVIGCTDGLEVTNQTYNAKINRLPVVTSAVIMDMPERLRPDDTYEISINGATDSDGQSLTYGLSSTNTDIAFSKTTGILANEIITLTVGPATRGADATITLEVSDGVESVTKAVTATINTLPIATGVVTDLPSSVVGDQTITCHISGALTTDGGAVTYTVINATDLVFSKLTGITDNEAITIQLPRVTSSTAYNFSIQVVDDTGEVSTSNKAVTLTVLPNYAIVTPSITYPTGDAVLSSDTFTFTFTPLTLTDV